MADFETARHQRLILKVLFNNESVFTGFMIGPITKEKIVSLAFEHVSKSTDVSTDVLATTTNVRIVKFMQEFDEYFDIEVDLLENNDKIECWVSMVIRSF